MLITYPEVKLYGEKKFVCTCGRKLKRRRKFFQTMNPWNQKSPQQIYSELTIEIEKWKQNLEPCTHQH